VALNRKWPRKLPDGPAALWRRICLRLWKTESLGSSFNVLWDRLFKPQLLTNRAASRSVVGRISKRRLWGTVMAGLRSATSNERVNHGLRAIAEWSRATGRTASGSTISRGCDLRMRKVSNLATETWKVSEDPKSGSVRGDAALRARPIEYQSRTLPSRIKIGDMNRRKR